MRERFGMVAPVRGALWVRNSYRDRGKTKIGDGYVNPARDFFEPQSSRRIVKKDEKCPIGT